MSLRTKSAWVAPLVLLSLSCSLTSLDDLQSTDGATTATGAASTTTSTAGGSGGLGAGGEAGAGGQGGTGACFPVAESFCSTDPVAVLANHCDDFDDGDLQPEGVIGDVVISCETATSAPFAMVATTQSPEAQAYLPNVVDGGEGYARLSFSFRTEMDPANVAIAGLIFFEDLGGGAQRAYTANLSVDFGGALPSLTLAYNVDATMMAGELFLVDIFDGAWRRVDLEIFRSDAYRMQACVDGVQRLLVFTGSGLVLSQNGVSAVGMLSGTSNVSSVWFDDVVVSSKQVTRNSDGTCPLGDCGCTPL